MVGWRLRIRGELARFDEFLDKHREVSEQLRKDPSLIDNREFLNNHPELEAYLHDHPGTREAIKSDPNGFMHAEDRFDRHEDARNREELANFDHFLDDHREIAEQVRKDPSLLDNHEFVKNHPALESYLQQHPGVRTELKENPNAFMREEDRFDRPEDRRDRDPAHERMHNFGEFLGGHANISQQLSKDPTLVKNEEYLTNHPELRDYLKTHPDVQQDLMANPQNFVKSAQQFNTNNTMKGAKAPAPAMRSREAVSAIAPTGGRPAGWLSTRGFFFHFARGLRFGCAARRGFFGLFS